MREEHAAVAPQNLDAEESLLGAMMLSPGAIIAVREVVAADDFYRASHGRIFRAALALHDRGEPVDAVTLASDLERRGELGEVGGKVRIHELAALVPAAANAGHYARIVREKAAARAQLRALTAGIASVHSTGVLGDAERTAIRDALAERTPPSASEVDGATFILDEPGGVPAVWGRDEKVLWPEGEPLLIVGPIGVGKTTLVQQLVLHRCGITSGDLLGLPVAPCDARVLYIAADRPRQAARSFRRMVGEEDREALRNRLVVWTGPPPFDLTADPARLAVWAGSFGVRTVVVDSVKDVASDIERPETGARLNRALQEVVLAGIEIVALHHQRKAQPGNPKPRKLADVFGAYWVTAGAGSVILLWGDAGASRVELRHLKQPAAEVGPLTISHERTTGRSVLHDPADGTGDGGLRASIDWFLSSQPRSSTRAVRTGVKGRDEEIIAALKKGADDGRYQRKRGEHGADLWSLSRSLFPSDGNTSEQVPGADPKTCSSEVFPAPHIGAGTEQVEGRPPPGSPEQVLEPAAASTGPLLPGDEGFRDYVNRAYEAGVITHAERHQRRLTHDLVMRVRLGARSDGPDGL